MHEATVEIEEMPLIDHEGKALGYVTVNMAAWCEWDDTNQRWYVERLWSELARIDDVADYKGLVTSANAYVNQVLGVPERSAA